MDGPDGGWRGSLASLDLAKDFCSSLMKAARFDWVDGRMGLWIESTLGLEAWMLTLERSLSREFGLELASGSCG